MQPDLFLSCLGSAPARQPDLFAGVDLSTSRCCNECGEYLVETLSGWLACPNGHGRLHGQHEPSSLDVEACGSLFNHDPEN